MHTVVRTPGFLSDAKAAGLSEDQQQTMVAAISKSPSMGELIPETGGCRKVRFAGRGKGKSGGFRTVHYYAAVDVPVIMLALINKGERANLSKAERNELRKEMASYVDDYREGTRKKISKMRRV